MGHFYSMVLPWEPNNENIKYRVSKKQGYSDNSLPWELVNVKPLKLVLVIVSGKYLV